MKKSANRCIVEIDYGDRSIAFEVVRTNRKTLGIHVYPTGRIEVRIPLDAALEDVANRVRRRARWIVRHQRRFAELRQPQAEKDYASGETHRYLGRQYRLKVLPISESNPAANNRPVRLVGRYFEIRTTEIDSPDNTRAHLTKWYRTKAEHHLNTSFAWGCELMRKYDINEPKLIIRTMIRRWGSCSKRGTVILNPLLVVTPTACIQYVVIHELCHVKHRNHGREFYDLLTRVMPDWQTRKKRLEQYP